MFSLLALLCFTSCWIWSHWEASHQQRRREQQKLALMALEISWATTTDDNLMMILSLICWHHYRPVLFTSQCLHNAINIKKGCWGKQSSRNTIVFPFNRGNYPQELGRPVMGRVGGTPDKIVEILNLPRYSIPVTLVHIYKTQLPRAHLEPDD